MNVGITWKRNGGDLKSETDTMGRLGNYLIDFMLGKLIDQTIRYNKF